MEMRGEVLIGGVVYVRFCRMCELLGVTSASGSADDYGKCLMRDQTPVVCAAHASSCTERKT